MNTQLQKENIVELPEGFTARGANLDDVKAALVLFNRWSRSVIGRDEITVADAIRNEWVSPGFDPAEGYSACLRTEWPDGWLYRSLDHVQTARPSMDVGTRRP